MQHMYLNGNLFSSRSGLDSSCKEIKILRGTSWVMLSNTGEGLTLKCVFIARELLPFSRDLRDLSDPDQLRVKLPPTHLGTLFIET